MMLHIKDPIHIRVITFCEAAFRLLWFNDRKYVKKESVLFAEEKTLNHVL